MYQFSDSDSTDSDEGIRFKTDSTRHKTEKSKHRRGSPEGRRRERDRSDERRRSRRRSSDSRSRRRRSRSRRRKSSPKSVKRKERSRERTHRSRDSVKSSKRDSESKKSDSVSSSKSSRPASEEKDRSSKTESGRDNGVKISKSESVSGVELNRSKSFDSDCQVGEIGSEMTTNLQTIGPALPPHLLNKSQNSVLHDSGTSKSDDSELMGPVLPPHLTSKSCKQNLEAPQTSEETKEASSKPANSNAVIGPALPPHLRNNESALEDEADNSTEELNVCRIGPILPSHLKKNISTSEDSGTSAVGPALPPHLRKSADNEDLVQQIAGPVLPPNFQASCLEVAAEDGDDDDDDGFGPLPPGMESKSSAHRLLEERALQMKIDKLNPAQSDVKAREEWMLELPEVHATSLGLGPRQFRKRAGPDMNDRSSWTDTPSDKAKKQQGKPKEMDLKKETELRELNKRDKQQEEMIKKHKKSKDQKSLLVMHQDELKKKKKDNDGEGPVRRPFSREIDLQVNRFDEAQKKAIFKKAQLLDDRFSQGQSKFLEVVCMAKGGTEQVGAALFSSLREGCAKAGALVLNGDVACQLEGNLRQHGNCFRIGRFAVKNGTFAGTLFFGWVRRQWFVLCMNKQENYTE